MKTDFLSQLSEKNLMIAICENAPSADMFEVLLTGTYYRIVAPYNDRAHWVITCSEMHRDRFASADDSTMVISANLRNQLLSL
jgi:hypothetical protein